MLETEIRMSLRIKNTVANSVALSDRALERERFFSVNIMYTFQVKLQNDEFRIRFCDWAYYLLMYVPLLL